MLRRLFTVVFLFGLASCGQPTYWAFESRTLGPPYGTTFVAVWVSDSPVDTAENVYVGFDRVELVGPEGDEVLFDGRQVYDLLSLQNGNRARLGEGEVSAQPYTMLRIVLAPEESGAHQVRSAGVLSPLVFASPTSAVIEIPLTITFAEDGQRDVIVDFNARLSLLESAGNWTFAPHTRVVTPETAGTATGTVTGQGGAPIALATVSAQRLGQEILSTRTQVDGSFRLEPMPAGIFDLVVTQVGYAPAVLPAVAVTAAEDTSVGETQLDVAVPGSVQGFAPIGTATSVQFRLAGALIGIAGVDALTGAFFANALPPGTYDVELVGPGGVVDTDPGVLLGPLGNQFVDFRP